MRDSFQQQRGRKRPAQKFVPCCCSSGHCRFSGGQGPRHFALGDFATIETALHSAIEFRALRLPTVRQHGV